MIPHPIGSPSLPMLLAGLIAAAAAVVVHDAWSLLTGKREF